MRDDKFDLEAHVRALSRPAEGLSYERFADLRDDAFSQPLDLRRAPWEICMVPRLADGRMAMVGKIHHSLVDGIAALQIVGLIVDEPEQGDDGAEPSDEGGRAAPSTTGPLHPLAWAADEAAHVARAGLGAARSVAGPRSTRSTPPAAPSASARGFLEAARTDLLPRAPASPLDTPLSPRRTLVGYHARALAAARRSSRRGRHAQRPRAGRRRRRGPEPRDRPRPTTTEPLKAMVPVSMRAPGEDGPGNRISMVYIQLPVQLDTPQRRLAAVRAETQALKSSARAKGTETLYAVGSLVPAPLRAPVVKALSSPRTFNLTISQSPGPRGELMVLGAKMEEVYSVVPITERHALAIGMVRYRRELFIGCYADPVALPEVTRLPELLDAELRALAQRD